MKKFILVLLLFTSTQSFCQRLSSGIKLGVNYSNLIPSAAEYKNGVTGGLYFNYRIAGKLSFQPELIFSSQGGRYHFMVNPPYLSYYGMVNYSYLNIPVLLCYQVFKIIHVEAGLQGGMLVRAKNSFSYNGISGTQDTKSFWKPYDLGLAIGLGVDLPAGFNVTFRFIDGLTNIDNTPPKSAVFGYQYVNSPLKNRVFQLTAGYRLFGKDK